MNSDFADIQDAAARARADALIRLLGDEDPKIFSTAWNHLEQLGELALPQVEEAASDAADPRVRVKARSFLRECRRRRVFEQWVAFCRNRAYDLEKGAFLIARSEYPEVESPLYQSTLNEYAAVLKKRVATARTTEAAVAALSHLIHAELGFEGNSADYYDPDNSYLNRVLDRRKGIPISLATIYLLLARRLSLPLYGVGMPQHFLLKFKSGRSEVFIDPFHRGRRITARDCARLLAESGIEFREGHLRAVTDLEILTRVLGNLLRVYHSLEDRRRLQRVTAMLRLLE